MKLPGREGLPALVDHILPHHLYNIPVPRVAELEERTNRKILEAHQLREEAQGLLFKAEETLYSGLGLPVLDEDDIEYFGGENGSLLVARPTMFFLLVGGIICMLRIWLLG